MSLRVAIANLRVLLNCDFGPGLISYLRQGVCSTDISMNDVFLFFRAKVEP